MESIYITDPENVQVVAMVLLNSTEQHANMHVQNVTSFNEEAYLESNMGERRKDLVSVGVLTLVYSLIFCTGVVGNLCTCIVIKRNAYLHSATNYYLFSLAVSDVLTLLLGKYISVLVHLQVHVLCHKTKIPMFSLKYYDIGKH